MTEDWREWLYFSKSERRGIFVLLAVLVGFMFLPKLYAYFAPKEQPVDYQAKYEAFVKEQEAIQSTWVNAKQGNEKTESTEQKKVPNEEVTPSQKNNLATRQPEKTAESQSLPIKEREPQPKAIVVDVNKATAAEFAQLKGIGEVFSNRIIKFRNSLGGFATVEQVGTTYGIEPEVFQAIRSQLTIQSGFRPKTININTATVEGMKSHPYISEKLAKQIVNYREKVHPFQTEADVKSLYFMTDELFAKLKPYLVW